MSKAVDRSEQQNDQEAMEQDILPERGHIIFRAVPTASEQGYWVIQEGFLAAETRYCWRDVDVHKQTCSVMRIKARERRRTR
jgi:hypothetical protein